MELSTREYFIFKSGVAHGEKYDYSSVEYINSTTPVKIICKQCNVTFTQTPNSHLMGRGCKPCGRVLATSKILSNIENFRYKANKIHKIGHYDYSAAVYKGNKIPLKIGCNVHSIIFEQTPNSHLKGNGCKQCGLQSARAKLTGPFQAFFLSACKLHPGEYEYFDDDYFNKTTSTKIRCLKHDFIFKQSPKSHLLGSECPICENENSPSHQPKTSNQFIIDSIHVHGNKFDYSKAKYINSFTKVTIICNICHAEFDQIAYSHTQGSGCPRCMMSRGESSIRLYLDTNKIKYSIQQIFSDCRSLKNRLLKFDFYLPLQNLLIEFDGKQHFELSNIRGYKTTQFELELTRTHDKIKNEYANDNKINLLRIPYWDMKRIPEILTKQLKSVTK